MPLLGSPRQRRLSVRILRVDVDRACSEQRLGDGRVPVPGRPGGGLCSSGVGFVSLEQRHAGVDATLVCADAATRCQNNHGWLPDSLGRGGVFRGVNLSNPSSTKEKIILCESASFGNKAAVEKKHEEPSKL